MFIMFVNCSFNFILKQYRLVLSCVVPIALSFAQSFGKPASSNPLILLDNRFLGTAPRALITGQWPTRRFLNPPNMFSGEQLSFEKPAANDCHFRKPVGANLAGFKKISAQ
jgi:hypothetical protein